MHYNFLFRVASNWFFTIYCFPQWALLQNMAVSTLTFYYNLWTKLSIVILRVTQANSFYVSNQWLWHSRVPLHLGTLKPFCRYSECYIVVTPVCTMEVNSTGLWEFLFSADFLFFENFLVPKFQLFLLFSAYFCHFTLISLCFSLFFACGISHLWW